MSENPSIYPSVLVGITTEQNISNLIPALQLKLTNYVAIESERARREHWGEGLKNVLGKLGITYNTIDVQKSDEGTINGLRTAIENGLKGLNLWSKPIGWIVGGGTKVQQLAIFTLFSNRLGDLGLYADPELGKLRRFQIREEDGYDESSEELHQYPTIEQIVSVFNRTIDITQRNPRFQVQKEEAEKEYQRFRSDAKYRQQWFKQYRKTLLKEACNLEDFIKLLGDSQTKKVARDKAKSSFEDWLNTQILKPNIISNKHFKEQLVSVIIRTVYDEKTLREAIAQQKPPHPTKTPFGDIQAFADYFEGLIVSLLLHQLEETLGKDRIANNVRIRLMKPSEIQTDSSSEEIAEHDVLIASPNGTLISIDAKTFAIKKKDFDARLLNLRNASGRFARYILVFPWFEEDIGIMPEALAEMPIRCSKYRQEFLVVSSSDKQFWVRKNSDHKMEVCNQKDKGAVLCCTLESFIKQLK